MEVVVPRWILKNAENGFARETLTFQNKEQSDRVIKTANYYLYKFFCIQPVEPLIDLANPNTINLLQRAEKWRQIGLSLHDDIDWEFPESLTLDDQYNILKKWDHTHAEGLASIGWFQIERQLILHGPLTLEKTFQTRMEFP